MTQKNYNGIAESTKQEYLTQAEGFLKRELDAKNIERTAMNICHALKAWSRDIRPNSYRKMRSALSHHQLSKKYFKSAFSIESVQRIGFGEKTGVKKKSCKHVREDEHQKLLTAVTDKNDVQAKSALILAYHLGLRPVEMTNILPVVLEGDLLELNIFGAKYSKTRSIKKRILYLKLEKKEKQEVLSAINALLGISKNERKAMQRRINRLSKKVFSARIFTPTIYSYRHQMGSDVKGWKTSSGNKLLSRKQASGIMGHKSQKALSSYGHANGASMLKRGIPIPSNDTVEQVLENSENKNYLKPKAKAELNVEHMVSKEPVNSENERGKQTSGANDIDSNVVKLIKQHYKTSKIIKDNSRNKSKSNSNSNEPDVF